MVKRERGPDGRVWRRTAVSAAGGPEGVSRASGGFLAVLAPHLPAGPVSEDEIELSPDERASLSDDYATRAAQLLCFKAARLNLVTEPDPAEVEERDRKARAAARLARWETWVPPRYVDAALDAVFARDREVGSDLAEWSSSASRPNLILTGPIGVGKTFAALATVRADVEAGQRVAYWSTGRLLQELRPGAESTPVVLAGLLDADVLVLDDLGTEKVSEWTSEQLSIVVDDRYQNLRPIVVTTNDLGSLVGSTRDRGRSRLLDGAAVIALDGERFR